MQTCVCIIHSILSDCVSATAVGCEDKTQQDEFNSIIRSIFEFDA